MYSNGNELVNFLISVAKEKAKAELGWSELEKDIYDTADELTKTPFDRAGAILRRETNNAKYPEAVLFVERTFPSFQVQSGSLTDIKLIEILRYQLLYLLIAYSEGRR